MTAQDMLFIMRIVESMGLLVWSYPCYWKWITKERRTW
jgi:hypothetical protein